MFFEFTAVERRRFEDLLYWLRRAGFAVTVQYSLEECTVDAHKGTTAVQAAFRRYGTTKLQVAGQIAQPGGKVVEIIRIQPMISFAKTTLNLADDEGED